MRDDMRIKIHFAIVSGLLKKGFGICLFLGFYHSSYCQRELYGFEQLHDSIRIDPTGDYFKVFTYPVYSNDSTKFRIYYDSVESKIYIGGTKNGLKNGLWKEYTPSDDYLKKKLVTSDLNKEDVNNLTLNKFYYYVRDSVLFSSELFDYSSYNKEHFLTLGTWKGVEKRTFQFIGSELSFDKKNRLREITYTFKLKDRKSDIEVTIFLDKKGKIISVIDKNPY